MSCMIARIQGRLIELIGDNALIELDNGLTYEVLLPAYTSARLGGSIGQAISLHTLHYVESQNQGATMLPRLAGFESPMDREFFLLFTTVKGVGNRKALRALALAPAQIAGAIADRDAATLQSLPEIGKRMAETIVATLSGKVEPYVAASSYPTDGPVDKKDESAGTPVAQPIRREALEVLMQLGENRLQAMQWIDQVMQDAEDSPTDVETLIERVYRMKSGG